MFQPDWSHFKKSCATLVESTSTHRLHMPRFALIYLQKREHCNAFYSFHKRGRKKFTNRLNGDDKTGSKSREAFIEDRIRFRPFVEPSNAKVASGFTSVLYFSVFSLKAHAASFYTAPRRKKSCFPSLENKEWFISSKWCKCKHWLNYGSETLLLSARCPSSCFMSSDEWNRNQINSKIIGNQNDKLEIKQFPK